MACAVPVVSGLRVKVKVGDRKCKGGCYGIFLSNHPLDCPICDQGGGVIYKMFRKFSGG